MLEIEEWLERDDLKWRQKVKGSLDEGGGPKHKVFLPFQNH